MEKKDETCGLAPLPGTPLAGALSTTLQDVLPRGSDAPRRSVAVPAPPGTWRWRGGDSHHAGSLSVGFPTCGRFRGGQEDVLWPRSVSTSCLERQRAEAGHGSPKIGVPSEVPGEIGARLAQERGAWGQKALNLGEFFQLKSIRDVKGLLKQPYFLNLICQKKPGYSTLLIACRGGRAEAGTAAPRALAPLPRAAPRHLGVTGTLSALLPRG